MPSILLTRPAQASGRFALSLRDRFGPEIRIVVSPLLSPQLLGPPVPAGPFRAVVFTSETGVAGFRQVSADRSLPAWCVGDRTAAAAQDAGFSTRSAGGILARWLTQSGARDRQAPCCIQGVATQPEIWRNSFLH